MRHPTPTPCIPAPLKPLPMLALLLAGTLLPGAAAPQQAMDEAYTALIREYTTEPFFLTPLVDHLPASAEVPTPLAFHGRIAGAPEHLHYSTEVHAYMRAVAAASPRVRVLPMGTSEEGRERILVVVGNAADVAGFEANAAKLKRLADPRITSEAEAAELIRTTKPAYWLTGAIHSPETGSPEMLMELVYRLAVSEDPFIREIRDNLIVMITPVLEPDGRDRQVDIHMLPRRDPDADPVPRLLYWGHYVAHDNNRDNIGLGLELSRSVVRTFREFHPTVLHDLHESASYLYASTGRGPYNAFLDPVVINEWNRLSYREVQDLTAMGVPGVYTFDFYDGWGANYMMWVAHMRNSIGRFYETQGARNAANYIVTANVDREWHRPSTPLRQVVWSLRNNVNLQQSGVLIALNEVATNRELYLRNFWIKSQRAVAKARAEGPAAYVLPADDPRPGQQARLLQLFQLHGFEIHRATVPFSAVVVGPGAAGAASPATSSQPVAFPAGSWIIRMDQPYSRGADMLLDRQYFNPNDPRPYDDVGWTVGPLFNVRTARVEDPAVLDVPMTLVTEPIRAPGGVEPPAERGPAGVWLVNQNADANLAAFRFAHPELRIEASRTAFTHAGVEYRPGSWIIRAEGNPSDVERILDAGGREFGFIARGAREAPRVSTHPVLAPRVAVVHTWQNTQQEGWLRMALDEYGIPYDYISVHTVRDTPDLKARWDVLVMGPAPGDALSIVRGAQGDRPQPWKATELTPNLGGPTSTDDMRGGLELRGVLNLETFVREGGVFVTLQSSSVLPVHFGLAEGVSIRNAPDLWARGGVYRAEVADARSPILYGYDTEIAVSFTSTSSPLLTLGGGGGMAAALAQAGGGEGSPRPGDTTARRSGRGGPDEPDIVQGRPRDLGQAGVEAFRERQREESDDATTQATAPTASARAILRFPRDPRNLLVSGGLLNGDRMAGLPALVDAPLGRGHVVLFSFNPTWRHHTHGSHALLFNVLMHHTHLDPERPVAEDGDGDR